MVFVTFVKSFCLVNVLRKVCGKFTEKFERYSSHSYHAHSRFVSYPLDRGYEGGECKNPGVPKKAACVECVPGNRVFGETHLIRKDTQCALVNLCLVYVLCVLHSSENSEGL